MSKRYLCLHQGSELYGSDRSFLSAIVALAGEAGSVDVVLPSAGPLACHFEDIPVGLRFYSRGIVRRALLRRPVALLSDMLAAVFFYVRLFRNYDVIYINTAVMVAGVVAAVFFRWSRRRVVVCHIREIPSHRVVVVLRTLFRVAGVRLIYNSLATRDAFSLPGVVIYNGVPDPLCDALPSMQARTALRLLLIGRINSWKGHVLLLRALREVCGNVASGVQVRFVGGVFEGGERFEHEVRNFIADSGLANCVSIEPFCDDPSEHFLWADYVVVPSIRPEPFGRVAIEAFSFGKPVIAANHGGLREIVTHGADGFLFVPGDKGSLAATISMLPASASEAYRDMSARARLRYEGGFTVSEYQHKVIEALT